MTDALKTILKTLISYPSITPEDKGCQDYMIDYLQSLGFHCQRFDNPPVSNFYASIGVGKPSLLFAGHSDVVPVGEEALWQTDPFRLTEKEDMIFGRGVADMKGSLAAMMLMASRFLKDYPDFQGRLAFLITSGEEGDHFHLGTPYVMQKLEAAGLLPDYCIVGEPSSHSKSGDSIKIGRRGSLSAKLNLAGIQGHVAYPHLAENPIHRISPAMAELSTTVWDEGNAYFPPTSLQITSVHAGGHGGNVIPGSLSLDFNFRYSTEQNESQLKQQVEDCFKRHGLNPQIDWRLNGEPFLTANGELLDAVSEAIKKTCGQATERSTAGGTSDARFIAPYGVEVIELGPPNQTIHQVNECLKLSDLSLLTDIYYEITRNLLAAS